MIDIALNDTNLALLGIIVGLIMVAPWIIDTVRAVTEAFKHKEDDL